MADQNETPEMPAGDAPPEPEAAPTPHQEPEPEQEPEEEEYDDRPYTAADFHNVVHKQVINAVLDTLSETKMHWEVVAPFLDTAREMCRGDFANAGSVQLHGLTQDGDTVAEAEEAYVEFSIADQDDGHLWFSETFWLSDIVLTSPEPAHVRNSIRALERSIAHLNAWLAEHDQPAASTSDQMDASPGT